MVSAQPATVSCGYAPSRSRWDEGRHQPWLTLSVISQGQGSSGESCLLLPDLASRGGSGSGLLVDTPPRSLSLSLFTPSESITDTAAAANPKPTATVRCGHLLHLMEHISGDPAATPSSCLQSFAGTVPPLALTLGKAGHGSLLLHLGPGLASPSLSSCPSTDACLRAELFRKEGKGNEEKGAERYFWSHGIYGRSEGLRPHIVCDEERVYLIRQDDRRVPGRRWSCCFLWLATLPEANKGKRGHSPKTLSWKSSRGLFGHHRPGEV